MEEKHAEREMELSHLRNRVIHLENELHHNYSVDSTDTLDTRNTNSAEEMQEPTVHPNAFESQTAEPYYYPPINRYRYPPPTTPSTIPHPDYWRYYN